METEQADFTREQELALILAGISVAIHRISRVRWGDSRDHQAVLGQFLHFEKMVAKGKKYSDELIVILRQKKLEAKKEPDEKRCPCCEKLLMYAGDGLPENHGYCADCVRRLDEADKRFGVKTPDN